MKEKLLKPDYLFEVSWEVCNKVGGIHTVISTKALSLVNELKNNYILIGPDVWRDTEHNPEFIEDNQLFASWKNKAYEEGLIVRIGRWNIPSNPIAIIVDFTKCIPKKDEIFKEFWEEYKLDSITGQWDYIEPALFGYTAGKAIESFTNFHLSFRHRIVAQFHEWMTGTGLLYLKSKMPQVGTIFTTHATVLGRCIAGNNIPLYSKLDKYNADSKAHEFNVASKQSLEKISAIHADCYTTVSDITAKECVQFHEKPVDLVTPNGFEATFVPIDEEFKLRRIEAKIRFYEVAEALLAREVSKDALIAGIGGRYEFKNKGIDIFIDALGKLNKVDGLEKEVLAFILIPANHHGPRKDVFQNLKDKNTDNIIVLSNSYLTHYLIDPELDPILNRIKAAGLNNSINDKVKVFFVPCYLNGDDGIFDKHYYDLLIGMDITIFPSYYEPWGYTPLESLAFHVPTITTTLAGFGNWVNTHVTKPHPGIVVIPRTDDNDKDVINQTADTLKEYIKLDNQERNISKDNAFEVSKIALWSNLISYYYRAYNIALKKVESRTQQFTDRNRKEKLPSIERKYRLNKPNWIRLLVQKNIPEKLSALDELSKNLWWSWNPDSVELFESIDPALWAKCEQNPILFLEKITFTRYQELENDTAFVEKLHTIYLQFTSYMMNKYKRKEPKIAYFSMEFGLHTSLKIYSGGLGVLAGDYLKEASDRNTDIIGIGLLYRYGYFTQKLSSTGQQVAAYDQQNFTQTLASPVRDENGKWRTISIALPGRNLYARLWKVEVGRTDLYLMDTDFEENLVQDRTITHHLYGGDLENRFKQEMLLGIGGIRTLKELGIDPDVYHINEGHAAFIGLEQLRWHIHDNKLSFSDAIEVVRSCSLFTTHTPVPAGHDSFTEDLVRTYMSHYPDRLKITWEQFMNLGRMNPGNITEKFSMSHLAANLSQEINGVSWLHGEVSKKMFVGLWPGYYHDELHVSYVTNGVHYPTWTAKEWRNLYESIDLRANFNYPNPSWDQIANIPDDKVWSIRNNQRQKLIDLIKTRLNNPDTIKFESPRNIVDIQENISSKALTLGFARRFATYKRAHLLFKDLQRLSEILNNEEMPVQLFFAGKAHPNDKAGQDLIKRIIEISKMPEFLGRIIFLQNYDMELARNMVQGVDIWLNTPTRPLEASGTSGQKAAMNGVLNFSVLDGWWVEGYREGAGWAISQDNTYQQQDFQDELDAEQIYSLLENEIVPMYYTRNNEDIPEKWVSYIKKSISQVASNFTTTRMMRDYENRFYFKLFERSKRIKANDFDLAKTLSNWKKRITKAWDTLEVIQVKQFNTAFEAIILGKEYTSELILDLGELCVNDIGVELVVADLIESNEVKIKRVHDFILHSLDGTRATFKLSIVPVDPGAFDCGIRIFAKNPELPHRMDFCLVRWV
ncbi:MAG: alpha-glucan family phosphorylase [Bacteroidales bacterium]|nr:MAG: alpha-glucan family phosphorylase [Bacteroidales bacterium]